MESFIHGQRKESTEELKQQHLFAKLELNLVKMEVNQNKKMERELYEELKRSKEYVKKLWELVQKANKEKNLPLELLQMAFHVPAEAKSSVTETNNFSNGSSIVDSSFEALSYFSGSSNSNQIVSGKVGFCTASPAVVSSGTPKLDPWDAEIDSRVQLKSLPQKGKLLEAVEDASALLQTQLLTSVPLPNFQNTPPQQSTKFAPFADFETPGIKKEPVFVEPLPYRTPLTCSVPMISFSDCPSGIINNAKQCSSIARVNNQVPARKQQRLRRN